MSLINFWEQESVGRDLWDKKEKEDLSKGAIHLIKIGQEIRPDKSFWDDFISIFSTNNDDASDLLGVSSDIISSWPSKIKNGLKEVEKDNINKKSTITNTGVD